MADKFQYEYDVVFSFAGTQRVYVEKVNNSLKKYDISVFYDNDNSVDLWGKNLYRYLDCLYSKKARYCVMFISKEYGERPWTIHESQSAQERMFCCYDNTEFQEYILPVRFDDTQIPGIRSTTGYMDANKLSPDELAEKIAEKLGKKEIAGISNIHDLFKKLLVLLENSIKDNLSLEYKETENYAQISDTDHGRVFLSIRLFESYITLDLHEVSAGYNPSILIFLNHRNIHDPIKVVNFSNYLFQVPELNLTYDNLAKLLNENLSKMLENQNGTISIRI